MPVVVFRVDAAVNIGMGHVMRCLTLAEEFAGNGWSCHFVCREHSGNLNSAINERGYKCHVLKQGRNSISSSTSEESMYAEWLGVSQNQDAVESIEIIGFLGVIDCIVVDHYALDVTWENDLKTHAKKMVVIDDLANRKHDCDVLIDQTLGRSKQDYLDLVPSSCKVLAGSSYALLRSEFAELRDMSIERRKADTLKSILITMGGVDAENVTGKVLSALDGCRLPDECRITVVMGSGAVWLDDVKNYALRMSKPVDVVASVDDMAARMADADLAIGAAGTTSWERCCLGLPSIMISIADNQMLVAQKLHEFGAGVFVGTSDDKNLSARLESAVQNFIDNKEKLNDMSERAVACVDGLGVGRIYKELGAQLE